MRLDPHNAKAGRNAIIVGLLTLTALYIGATSGLPDNPKDPPPPPSTAGYLFSSTALRETPEEDNNDGSGIPVISGVPELDNTLTALKGTISDLEGTTRADNGETGYAYRYQWIRVDGNSETDIPGATSSTYVLTTADIGDAIKVKVWYVDDAGNSEGPVISDTFNTSPMILVKNTGQPILYHPVTQGNYALYGQEFTTGSNPDGYTLTSIGVYIHQPPSVIHQNLVTLNSSQSIAEPGSVLAPLSNPDTFSWASTNYFTPPPDTRLWPNTKYWVVVHEGIGPNWDHNHFARNWMSPYVTLSQAEDPESLTDWVISDYDVFRHELSQSWRRSDELDMMMEIRGVLGSLLANYAATGAPFISGEDPGAGYWLSASTSEIADDNGNSNAESDYDHYRYTYQWVRVDSGAETDIAGATNSTYLLTDDDVGKQVKVEVAFVDDAGNTEELVASAAFPSGGTILAAGSPELGPPNQVLVENTSNQALVYPQTITAQSFRTGNNPDGYRLDVVGVAIGNTASTDILVRIFTRNSANLPDNLVHTLTTTTVAANAVANFNFVPQGYATLLPNTNYFVVVTSSNGMDSPGASLVSTSDTSQNSDLSDGWNISNRRYAKNTWGQTYWTSYQYEPVQISIHGAPVNP